jgi:hypothetical protein
MRFRFKHKLNRRYKSFTADLPRSGRTSRSLCAHACPVSLRELPRHISDYARVRDLGEGRARGQFPTGTTDARPSKPPVEPDRLFLLAQHLAEEQFEASIRESVSSVKVRHGSSRLEP